MAGFGPKKDGILGSNPRKTLKSLLLCVSFLKESITKNTSIRENEIDGRWYYFIVKGKNIKDFNLCHKINGSVVYNNLNRNKSNSKKNILTSFENVSLKVVRIAMSCSVIDTPARFNDII